MSLVGAFAASHAPGITGRPTLRIDTFLRYPRETLEAEAEPGAQEIPTWIVVAAAAGDATGSLLTYQPVPAWSTGCAVAALDPR